MTDQHILEYNEHGWRLIILEHDDDGCKSVKNIIESANLSDLLPHTSPEQIDRFDVADPDKLPNDYRQRYFVIHHEARLTYIRDCYQAVHDAELELVSRRVELQQAINGDFHV